MNEMYNCKIHGCSSLLIMNYTLEETMNSPGNRKMETFVTKLLSNF